ncbi:hypothetical protein F3Y22_tig00003725pilonHSYRG00281 [Hibiscus syriacus]|uniref:Uncharacterized protein n=1 Tax=Hibiscus syriacus TaxID=106335 RepID=A0A6A3CIM9_HIBSY|nr:hypothetical protein F3Y22_tig00003725pilonHSYRG00281 [Hibiscus syriacus]
MKVNKNNGRKRRTSDSSEWKEASALPIQTERKEASALSIQVEWKETSHFRFNSPRRASMHAHA